MTSALDALDIAMADVDNLINHHPKSSTPGRGRPTSDEGPLLRSCVVLVYAAWEVYVEDSTIWAVDQLASNHAPEDLPEALRAFVAMECEANPWQLAGEGWRAATIAAVTDRVRGNESKGTFGLNTAGPRQIAALHDQLFGQRLLDSCRWQRKSTKQVKKDLADLVTVRGSVAHTGRTPGPLSLAGVRDWRAFVQRLAQNLDRHITQWVVDAGATL